MAHLVADFIESAKSAAATLKKAEDAGDLHAVRVVCLQLQGHGSSFGFKILTDVTGWRRRSLAVGDERGRRGQEPGADPLDLRAVASEEGRLTDFTPVWRAQRSVRAKMKTPSR